MTQKSTTNSDQNKIFAHRFLPMCDKSVSKTMCHGAVVTPD